MVSLPTVEVPGYAEALKREAAVRDRAWLGGNEIVAGVEVRPLSLRTTILLEQARNGFFVPCRFDNGQEVVAHAVQVLYFCRPGFSVPDPARFGVIRQLCESVRRQRFIESVMRRMDYDALVREVREWLDDAFMDCPSGSADNLNPASHAAAPAYVLDLLAAGGYNFTEAEVMDMPLRRLWQLMRLAARRVNGASLSNPSDELAVAHIAKQQGAN